MTLIITGAKITNIKAIENQLAQAFEDWARQDVAEHFYDQFHNPMWEYGRDTVRENPSAPMKNPTAGEERDIYDFGDLYESGKDVSISIGRTGAEASWTWDAKNRSGKPYASYVHEGTGTNYGYPRRWTQDLAEPQRFHASQLKQGLLQHIRDLAQAK